MSPRGGRWERIAVRLNAILRKVPKERSLDGKTWHAETSARRSLMRYIVGVVARLIEEEDERENDRHLAEHRLPEEGTTIDLGGTSVHVKPGDTITIRPTGAAAETQRIPVERVIVPEEDAGPIVLTRTGPNHGPAISSCPECGKAIVALPNRDVRAAEWLTWHKPECRFARSVATEAARGPF